MGDSEDKTVVIWENNYPENLRVEQIKKFQNKKPGLITSLGNIRIIFAREFKAYFASPIAYIVMTVFLFVIGWLTLSGGFTMQEWTGDFFERARCDAEPMFKLLPWLFLFFVPAVSMRLWAEERQVGSFELLITLPMKSLEIILGKLLGAWGFVSLMLIATIPFPLVLNFFGTPDYGQITASYLGGILLAGSFLAVGSFASSLTKDQITAFIIGIFISGLFVLLGSPAALEFLTRINVILAQIASRIALSERFDSISRGVLDLGDMIYYVIFIGFFLYLTTVSLKFKRQ